MRSGLPTINFPEGQRVYSRASHGGFRHMVSTEVAFFPVGWLDDVLLDLEGRGIRATGHN